VTPTDAPSARARRAVTWLLAPIDGAWLAAFRILFGLVLAWSMLRFITSGWVERFFVEPTFHFKYWGFEWVEPLSGPGMHALFAALVLLALGLAAGFAFRVTAPAFALGLTYVQLIDVSTYLNHYYLASLLAFLLACSPAHRSYSVDAWLRRRFGRPERPPEVARAWLVLLRVQVAVVYVFAGLAKAQPDWLVHAQPLRIWLGASVDLPLIGPLFALPGVPLVLSWCGFLFDTTVVFFLLARRTRPYAYAAAVLFHVVTRLLFPIGMFPAIMLLSALVFFEPGWPRHALAWLAARVGRSKGGAVKREPPARPAVEGLAPRPAAVLGLALGALYCLVQLGMPLRALAYGGNVLWHEQGMRFSWRVMVRAKGGSTTLVVRQRETGRVIHVSPSVYLTGMQESEMSSQPDLIVQLAHHVEQRLAERGFGQVEVYAESRVSLNGRRSRPFIDPGVDLTRVQDGMGPSAIVLPAPAEGPPHTRPVL
jgi:vitamin K-dependent gamma-carboxylase